jgi:ketosteroid isomerase-like protein
MIKRLAVVLSIVLSASAFGFAQDSSSAGSATRQRTTVPEKKSSSRAPVDAAPAQEGSKPVVRGTVTRSGGVAPYAPVKGAEDPTSRGVTAAFNALVDGIRHTSVAEVTSVYWNSPQLLLFNNNGTVTRGWEQMKSNREASYPNLKDVKLEVSDVHVQMLGRDGAIVTCEWTQSQTAKGLPETASGRMTLAFRRVNGEWRASHLHSSPNAPDPSRTLPSEREEKPAATPAPSPASSPAPSPAQSPTTKP